jgi:hypothetical protein
MSQESCVNHLHRGEIMRSDVIPALRYGRMRSELRKVNAETSRIRRIAMGPMAGIYFENWNTIWFQLHEMLFLVDRDEVRIDEELRAFSLLVPKGQELVATVTLENDGLEKCKPLFNCHNDAELSVSMTFAGERIVGRAEIDAGGSCTSAQGPIVQFTRFEFAPRQVSKFCMPGARVVLRMAHPAWEHVVLMTEETRRVVCRDLTH